MVPASPRLLVPEVLHGVPHELEKRKTKQAYYYGRVAKELYRLKPRDVLRVKLRPISREWTKAAVDKEVDIRSYQVPTEDGRTYRRNSRHLKLIREPFLTGSTILNSRLLVKKISLFLEHLLFRVWNLLLLT